MCGGRLLLAIGLVRQGRPAGFCPACRVLMKALDGRQELAKPMVAALVVLAVAATWVVMMTAMILPSAIPVVLEFAPKAGRGNRWQAATGVLAVTYLGVW